VYDSISLYKRRKKYLRTETGAEEKGLWDIAINSGGIMRGQADLLGGIHEDEIIKIAGSREEESKRRISLLQKVLMAYSAMN